EGDVRCEVVLTVPPALGAELLEQAGQSQDLSTLEIAGAHGAEACGDRFDGTAQLGDGGDLLLSERPGELPADQTRVQRAPALHRLNRDADASAGLEHP